MKKIWLDDVRPPPDNSWTWIKDGATANQIVQRFDVDEISFDHDLGDVFWNGYLIAKTIEHLAFNGMNKRIKWNVHSANPVGRANITAAMNNAEKFWAEHDIDAISDEI